MPIPQATVLTVNTSGHTINSWGQNTFFLPHMITVDKQNNVWLTDVALHQVCSITAPRSSLLPGVQVPALRRR